MIDKSLYKNDGVAIEKLSSSEKKSIKAFWELIKNGQLKLIDNYCLCKNEKVFEDVIVTEKDRYGIPFTNVICSKCGLVRSVKVFDEVSNMLFYKKYYRDIYVGLSEPDENFFIDQVNRGQYYLNLIKSKISISDLKVVAEIGCGSGGVLYPFFLEHLQCIGFDYNENYLSYGRKYGLKLHLGDYKVLLKNSSVDLIILSHVMEHFLNPIDEVISIIKKIKPGGFLFIEVPGIFFIHNTYKKIILYFQNAHVYNYYEEYLRVFFQSLGMEIVYSNEQCSVLLKKPVSWINNKIDFVYSDSLSNYPEKILKYLKKNYLLERIYYREFKKYINIINSCLHEIKKKMLRIK